MLLIMIILCLILLIALADDLQKFISSNQSVWQGSIFKVRQRERGEGGGRERAGGRECTSSLMHQQDLLVVDEL